MSSPAINRNSNEALLRIAQRLKRERNDAAQRAAELSAQVELLELWLEVALEQLGDPERDEP